MPAHLTWRPQPLWIPMGLLLGAFAGATIGAVLLFGIAMLDNGVSFGNHATPFGTLGAMVVVLVVGCLLGGIAGSVVGMAVGAQLMFLVGAHLPVDAARRRAHRLGFVLPPLTLLAASRLLLGGWSLSMPTMESLSTSATEWLWSLACLGGSALLGARLARWCAGFGSTRRTTS